MTTEEFSNEFDVLLNSYSGKSIELDEYEKSVLLTEAQEFIVQGLYNGTLTGKSFEETEELRRYLDSLIITDYPTLRLDSNPLDSNSYFYTLKDNVWYITYESVEILEPYCKNNKTVKVIPIRQDEWHRIKENPFKRPNKRKVIRLDKGSNTVELVSKYPIKNYLIKYLCKPSPIILINLEDSLSINGLTIVTECKLNPVLHRTILEKAVELALHTRATK